MPNPRPVAPIPVLRPRLPGAEALLPWLRRIDQNRIYSNFGPLSEAFAQGVADHLGIAPGGVLPLANATLGLTAGVMAVGAERGSLCAIPAFTFAATAHAVLAAGLEPWLLDVEEGNWQLTPRGVEQALATAPGPVGAVMPVCPFGQPVDWQAWTAFRRRSGIPVVIDAAAGFDGLRASPLPAVVSLHATKALGIGEGAVMVCADHDLLDEVKRRINFGFQGSRVAGVIATNAKMSEIHAAIGLAALAAWPATRADFVRVQTGLRHRLEAGGLACPAGIGEDWVSSTFCLRLPADAAATGEALARLGIETRRWWGDGLHRHPAFGHCPRTQLPATEALGAAVLGLPCFVDLDETALDAIASRTLAALRG